MSYRQGNTVFTDLCRIVVIRFGFTHMKGCSVQVGPILKLGLSTRLFLLREPERDMEAESEQSELAAREIEMLECQWQEEERTKQEDDQGTDWGMGEFRYKPQLSQMFQSVKYMGNELHQSHDTVLLLCMEDMETYCLDIICCGVHY
jgi:hypothetical protein